MKNVLCVSLAAATLATSLAATPASAGGYYRRGVNPGAAAAIGLLGGVAVGAAIASSARAAPAPAWSAPPEVVVERAPRRVYVSEAPVEECVTERRRVWVPGWGWEMRRRTVCE